MKAEDEFKPDYDFLTKIYDGVNFYDIVRELQGTGREQIYDSDILYCMVKAAKAYHQSQLQALKEYVSQMGWTEPRNDFEDGYSQAVRDFRNLITNLEDK